MSIFSYNIAQLIDLKKSNWMKSVVKKETLQKGASGRLVKNYLLMYYVHILERETFRIIRDNLFTFYIEI